jgi:hypothetical protein
MKNKNAGVLTPKQEQVSFMCNIYPDNVFIEMVNSFDSPQYWINLQHDKLADYECNIALDKLKNMFREYNKALQKNSDLLYEILYKKMIEADKESA